METNCKDRQLDVKIYSLSLLDFPVSVSQNETKNFSSHYDNEFLWQTDGWTQREYKKLKTTYILC